MHRNNLFSTQAEAGMFRSAVAGLEALIEEAPPDWRILPETYRFLSEAYLGSNQLRPAQETAQLALVHAETTGNPRDLAGAWQVMARVAARGKQQGTVCQGGDSSPSARDYYAESLRRYSDLNLRRDVGITLWRWAEYELVFGNVSRATAMVHRARELFTVLELPHWLRQMELSLQAAGFTHPASPPGPGAA